MLFDSLEFLIFLPAVIVLYYLLPHKVRWVFLLLASYFFYASWKIEFLTLIIYSTVVDYFVAIKIDKTTDKFKRKFYLWVSLVSNFGVLFLFKYFNFFVGSRNYFLDFAGQHPKIEWITSVFEYGIPVGISFYTFQTVSYTLDVYYDKVKPEKNIGKFALFVSYFPQLVAGPIERFSNLHKQIFAKHKLNYDNLSNGFRLILYGLFVKMVIADNLAPLVDQVFSNPMAYSQTDNTIGLLFFSLQIYADFNGYSLIAIGVAKLMGVNLMDNFKTPYFSTSIKEFWTRWHISLSTWFRDYLYIPLGGNKVKYFRWLINIMIVFVVSGIWHGANFTFIVWGAIHGLVYLTEILFTKQNKRPTKNAFVVGLKWTKTFLVVNLAWVFFRSDSIANVYLSISRIFGHTPTHLTYQNIAQIEKSNPSDVSLNYFTQYAENLNKSLDINPVFIGLIALLLGFDLWIQQSRFDKKVQNYPFAVRWGMYSVLIFCIMALSGSDFYQFIYFQF